MLATLIATSLLLGQTVTPDVKSARALATEADTWIGKQPKAARQMFMAKNEGKTWVKMKTETDFLDKEQMWNNDISAVAFVWARNGKVLQVNITEASSSGDWSHGIESTYRKDGTLARTFAAYSAFSPVEGSVQRELIYSAKGKKIYDKTSFTSLDQKETLTAEQITEIKQYAPVAKPWLKAKSLPFRSLLKK